MTAPSPSTGFDPRDDLVEDRAIEDAADDHFGHVEFADQAGHTIRAVKTPANIAVYAPWGSGKTSLANLLRSNLESDTCGFAYFDAFKYAEAPLRREFIRRIARELDVEDVRFGRGLYDEQTTNDFRIDKASLKSLATGIGAIAGGALFVTAILSALLAQASHKAFWPAWSASVLRLLPSFLASAVVLGPLLALVTAQLGVTRKRYAPQSDEEFESLFCEVVEQARLKHKKWDRIVVFIDELDRCAADEVASTLETLRTFLEVKPCIFIVAADRSVLESAVASKGRQETPFNARNPYYSLGSSYLDKIFQYQWQLPPMMPSSLTRFGQALVSGRARGLWSGVDVSEVVSVLVPLHVQSPRRVKELLNAFAMTYRIAERRTAQGRLEGDLPRRAAELAKLVCLQHEFPTFASDLPNEPRLTELVLSLAEDPTTVQPPNVATDVWQRAVKYSKGQLELDIVIANSPSSTHGDGNGVQSEDDIICAQGHLLIRYLQKTRRVAGPEADLIYMEGVGSAFGLPTALAVRLKSAATEGRSPEVSSTVAALEPDEQRAALQLLAQHVREAQLGIEGDNALSTMLRVIAHLRDLELDDVVADLADAANVGIRSDGLPPEDVEGAVLLGLATSKAVGRELIGRALGQDVVTTEPATAAMVVKHLDGFSTEDVPRLGEVVAALLVDLEWDAAVESVLAWTDERAEAVLEATRSPMLARIEAADAPAEESGEVAQASAPPSTGSTEAEAVTSAEDAVLAELESILHAAHGANRKRLVQALLELVLSINSRTARDIAAARLSGVAPVTSSRLTSLALTAAGRRKPSDTRNWVDPLDPSVVSSTPRAASLLEGVALAIWRDDTTAVWDQFPVVKSAVEGVSRLSAAVAWQPNSLVTSIAELAASPALDEPSLRLWSARVQVAAEFDRLGLIPAERWRPQILETAVELLSQSPPDDPSRHAFVDSLSLLCGLVQGAQGDVIGRLFVAIAGASTIDAVERLGLRVRVAAGDAVNEIPQTGVATDEVVGAFDSVADDETRSALAAVVVLWIRGTNPTPEDVMRVLLRYPGLALPDEVRVELSSYTDRLEPSAHRELITKLMDNFPSVLPTDTVLDALHFHEGDLRGSADLLVEAVTRATNEDHRRGLFRIWSALRLTEPRLVVTLVEGVMKPLIRLNKTSRDIVLQNLNLVQVLSNVEKRSIAETFEANTAGEEWSTAKKRLADASLMYEHRTGPFGIGGSSIDHLRT